MLPPAPRRLFRLPLRAIAWFALGLYLATASGMPLPVLNVRVSDERYPCENHGCGCASAASCWRECCCFSLEQKLAWARANGVTPPASVQQAAKQKAPAPRGGSCCRSATVATAQACCSATPQKKSCCSTQVAVEPKAKVQWQFALRALGCRGQAGDWLVAEPAVPVTAVELVSAPLPPEWLTVVSETAEPLLLTPPTPPPRAC